ncbi:MAG: hypothetical protein AB2A00_05755 [Myxococcota bacterium]
MAVAANQIHHRTVAAFRAAQVNPQIAKYMQPELKEKLDNLARRLIPLLAAADDEGAVKQVLNECEQAYIQTREVLGRVQAGVRLIYTKHQGVMARLEPLRLGADPTEDAIHSPTSDRRSRSLPAPRSCGPRT